MGAAWLTPAGLAGIGIAGKDAGRPFVVARPRLMVPRARIAGAVIDEIELGIVGEPAPDIAAALAPGVRRPARHPEVLAAVAVVERLEIRADQNFRIRARRIG